MKNLISSSLIIALLAGSGVVLAGEHQAGINHAAMQGMEHNASAAQAHKAEGVVNSVDLRNGKVNMTHGPVESLGWPGMTMDFAVKDKAILKGINPGQKVAFEVVKEGPGKFYVNRITPLK
ncbi:MAG: copper-binding protein [Gallionella sp.]|jgi:Cu/Ag efflux protein CusF|nr:copper-binding protein [Gallionella sp.]